ncbi:hypothetical protein BC834DRAFT_277346 [Gloeopeniophorella convolvens]|nr:hypothetical protein BC834DRAFT_277346 [Gloeopeniophorella convolvens]
MLPFFFALVLAVGLPFLPSSVYRVLHLPTLKFNILSASRAPEQGFVSSEETSLIAPVSSHPGYPIGESSHYLVFPSAESLPDASGDALNSSSLSLPFERVDNIEPSIWDILHPQLVYRLAEAMFVIAVSFIVGSQFLSHHHLNTLMERLCTAFFILWHHNPKVTLSAFLQDVLLGLHKYWMDDAIVSDRKVDTATGAILSTAMGASFNVQSQMDPATDSSKLFNLVATKIPAAVSASGSRAALSNEPHLMTLPAIVVRLPPKTPSTNVPSRDTDQLESSQLSYLLPKRSESVQIDAAPRFITQPTRSSSLRSSSPIPPHHVKRFERDQAHDILGSRLHSPSSRSRQPTSSRNSTLLDAALSSFTKPLVPGHPGMEPRGGESPPLNPFQGPGPAPSFRSISIEDLYKSSNGPDGDSKASLSHPSEPYPFLVTDGSPQQASYTCDSGPHLKSASTLSNGGRRRFKSDGIQVRAARCHLGGPAALLDPAKVDVTCAFWTSSLQREDERVSALEEEALAPGFLSTSLEAARIIRKRPEQASMDGGFSPADAALAGIVAAPDGGLVVPASQRPDGSMRKEIRVRPNNLLSTPLTEKYRPPGVRARTSTWDSYSRGYPESPPSSPCTRGSMFPFTPKSSHPRLSHYQDESSRASLSCNWRNTNAVGTPQSTEKATLTSPIVKISSAQNVTRDNDRHSEAMGQGFPVSPPAEMTISAAAAVTSFTQRCSEPGSAVSDRPAKEDSPRHSTTEINEGQPGRVCRPVSSPISLVVEQDQGTKSAMVAPGNSETQLNQQSVMPERLISDLVSDQGVRSPLWDAAAILSSSPTSSNRHAAISTTEPVTGSTKEVPLMLPTLTMNGPRTPRVATAEDTGKLQRHVVLLSSSPRKRKPSAEPGSAKLPELSEHRSSRPRPRPRLSAPHLGKNGTKSSTKAQRTPQTPESSKRRRVRTASAQGVENSPAAAIDRSGQIVLPSGTGWKGRSLTPGRPPQRQRQPTAAVAA